MNKGKVVLTCLVMLSVLALSLAFFNSAVSPLQRSNRLSSSGMIRTVGVGVYSDESCSSRLASINWGTLDPGANQNVVSYIRNEGNLAVTLSLSTDNWNPTDASQYLTLTWDYGGSSIAPNEVVKVTFRLSVSSSISSITDFSFDIIIVGTG